MPLSDRDYMRAQPKRSTQWWFAHWTPWHWIIAINIVVFCLQHLGLSQVLADSIDSSGVSVRALAEQRFWTIVTYMFVHDGVMHLVGNLLLIGFAGARVQQLLGERVFLLIYFTAGVVGACAQMAVMAYVKHQVDVPIIGASACAFGLVLALAALLPAERLTNLLYFILPINTSLWTLAMVLVGIEFVLGMATLLMPEWLGSWGGIAYFAHLGGALTGWQAVRMMGFGGTPMTYERLWKERRLGGAPPKRKPAIARVRRAAPEMDVEELRRQRQAPGRKELPIMDNVNEILEKISREGMGSLSVAERHILDTASRQIAKKKDSPDAR